MNRILRLRITILCTLLACLTGCFSPSIPLGGVDVVFPNTSEPPPAHHAFKPIIPDPKDAREVTIDGVLAYHITWGDLQTIRTEIFDTIKPGLTLKEIINVFGPGYQTPAEGVGLIYWKCKDGRILNVWPREYKLHEKPKYWMNVRGVNQKHDLIETLAHNFIAGIRVVDTKALVVLKEDTYLAKAGNSRYYGVGDCFQKVEPLPRIDFRIEQIDPSGVHCKYFYQAPPDGLIHYSEHGNIILKEKANKEIQLTN